MARNYEESAIQTALVRWFDLQYPKLAMMLIAFINGADVGARVGARWKGMGVRAGTPDMLLAVAGFVDRNGGRAKCRGIWIEVKAEKGRLSCAQKKMHIELYLNGWEVMTIKSLEEGVREITRYLSE